MDKSKIIANLSSLTAEQLFKEITEGNITLDELRETGNFGISDPRYKEIKPRLDDWSEKEKTLWKQISNDNNKKNKNDLVSYISEYPKGAHINEACSLIAKCEQQEHEILSNLFSNKYSPAEIIQYIDNHIITENDLIEKGVPPEIINILRNKIETPKLSPGNPPEKIPDGYTEVYFWGITGSGKTTALAAILHMAEERGLLQIVPESPGYRYALTLKNIFRNDNLANDCLPEATEAEATQYLPFLLKKTEEKYSRSVSLIELSGELFKCFLTNRAQESISGAGQKKAFESLEKFLKSKNRKIHCFFIDYDKNNKKDSDGYTQNDYLSAAQQYFGSKKIFEKTTTNIYIVLTKSDLMEDEYGKSINVSQWDNYAKRYLHERHSSFINYLKNDCEKYSINNPACNLEVIPFSLGKVYFQKICNFNGTSANRIIDKILLDRIEPSKKTIFDIFNR